MTRGSGFRDIKTRLFKEWLPDKAGGLNRLVELAANAAAEVVEQGCGHAGELERLYNLVEGQEEALKQLRCVVAQEEGEPSMYGEDGAILLPSPLTPEGGSTSLAQYPCTQCDVTHKSDSKIGQEHLQQYLIEQVVARVEPV